MASATAIVNDPSPSDAGMPEADEPAPRPSARRSSPLFRLSPLTWRILAVNVLALAILGGSMLYLGRYQDRLVQSELDSLTFEARIFAGALGEGAVIVGEDEGNILSQDLARSMVRRLVEATGSRTRLYDLDRELIADSRVLSGPRGVIEIEDVPPPPGNRVERFWRLWTRWLDEKISRQRYTFYKERPEAQEVEYQKVAGQALQGQTIKTVWRLPGGGLLLSITMPVQSYKQILGAIMITRTSATIDAALADVRADVLKAFAAVLGLTVLLSFYLARTIAEPLRRLAAAVRDVQDDQAQITGLSGSAGRLAQRRIPDMTARRDEIGELSRALREMTAALTVRLEAIENFAADVAHEIKNPLTSLRSAVETVARIHDPARQQRLMEVIRDDVDRLDRLITDIAGASRLDAELSRASAEIVDIGAMLATLADHYAPMEGIEPNHPRVILISPVRAGIKVRGLETRLTQVLQNLIDNALSFAPSGSTVRLTASKQDGQALVFVDDDGPGIPENKLAAIFDRFYSERPKSEKFGTHSGLGLSIAKQITEAHQGRIWAENRRGADGDILGARFGVVLPLAGT